MKRVLPICICVVILFLGQAPSAFSGENVAGGCPIIKEANVSTGARGLGWFEDVDLGDPGVLAQVFRPFQNEEQLFIGANALRHFRFLFHSRSNPLLIDRPPPVLRA